MKLTNMILALAILTQPMAVFADSAASGLSAQETKTYLESEAKKDVDGKSSCFGGAVRSKDLEMQDSYGGRYQGGHEVNVATVSGTEYRYIGKYCSGRLDKNMKPTEDDTLVVYRICDREDLSTHVATVVFGSSTSGTFEEEGVAFKVESKISYHLVIKADADYNPEDSDIVVNQTKKTVTCSPLNL